MSAPAFVIVDEESGAFWSSVDHGEVVTVAPDAGASSPRLFLSVAERYALKWSTLLDALAALSMFPSDGASARILHFPSLAAAVIQHRNEGV